MRKLAVENYCESYHLPWVHPGLNSYSRLEDHYNILSHDSFAGQGSYVYNPQISDDGRGFPSFEGLSEKWDTAAEYCAFFPNVLFGVHKDHAYAILLIPNAQNKTTEHVAIYYADEQACDDSYADMRAQNTAMWKDIFIEDKATNCGENIKFSKEIIDAKKTFQKYRWPSIDVTRKSVEEAAASIIKIHEIYLNNVK